jgi:hypothetical protein
MMKWNILSCKNQDIGLQSWKFLIDFDWQISYLQAFVCRIILMVGLQFGTGWHTLEYLLITV